MIEFYLRLVCVSFSYVYGKIGTTRYGGVYLTVTYCDCSPIIKFKYEYL